MVGEEITERNCSGCPFIRVEHGTFVPTAFSLATIQRYLLWQRMGLEKPKTIREADAFAEVANLDRELNG